jgi:hypothetical protein
MRGREAEEVSGAVLSPTPTHHASGQTEQPLVLVRLRFQERRSDQFHQLIVYDSVKGVSKTVMRKSNVYEVCFGIKASMLYLFF